METGNFKRAMNNNKNNSDNKCLEVSEGWVDREDDSGCDQFDGKSLRRRRRKSRKLSILTSPAAFLCDLILRQKVENQLYRSESFCFLQKVRTASTRKLGVALENKKLQNNGLLISDYAEPVDVLAHPELWSHNLSLSSDSGLGRDSSPLSSSSSSTSSSQGSPCHPLYENLSSSAALHVYENVRDECSRDSVSYTVPTTAGKDRDSSSSSSSSAPPTTSPSTHPSSSLFSSVGLYSSLSHSSVARDRPDENDVPSSPLVSPEPLEHVYERIGSDVSSSRSSSSSSRQSHLGTRTVRKSLSDPGGIRSDRVYPYYTHSSIPVYRKRVRAGKQLRNRHHHNEKRSKKCGKIYHILKVVPPPPPQPTQDLNELVICPDCDFWKTWTILTHRHCCCRSSCSWRRRRCCCCCRCRCKKTNKRRENTKTTSATATTPSLSSMARKRYETAFLPSSSSSPARRSPDVDTLLLAIEATSLVGDNEAEGRMKLSVECHNDHHPPHPHHHHQLQSSPAPLCRSEFSRSSDNDDDEDAVVDDCRKKPLSEPLPLKKYASSSVMTPSSGHPPRDDCRIILKKENSISSLESLDSTKSEDLHHHHQSFVIKSLRSQKVKVLSPISDKSPLEPKGKSGGNPFQIETRVEIHGSPLLAGTTAGVAMGSSGTLDPWDWSGHEREDNTIVNAAELTNVPWEMPKLRRKLAMLADSGISLDLPPREFELGGLSGEFSNRSRTLSSDFFSRPPMMDRPGSTEGSNSFGSRKDSGTGHVGQLDRRGNLDLKLPLRQTSFPGEDMYAQEEPPPAEEIGGDYLPSKADRARISLDFGLVMRNMYEFDPNVELECQDWFYGAITRCEAEDILRPTKQGSFLVRNCESSNFNQYSLSLKCARGFIHIRIEPNSLGTFSLGDQMFPTVPHLVLHFMTHRLPIKGAEHVKLVYPVINQLL